MLRSLFSCIALIAIGSLAAGCASQSDGHARQVRELGAQVRQLQATSDRLEERLAAVENARRHEPTKPLTGTAPPSDVPELPIVRLHSEAMPGAAGEGHSGAAETDEPRPLIVGEGSRVETRASGESAPANTPLRRSKDKANAEPSPSKRSAGPADAGKK